MNYVEKVFDEIFESMLKDSLDKGLISQATDFEDYIKNQEDISNYYVMDKAVIAEMFAKVYQDMTSIYESAKIEYAEGDDLDELGALIGISRPQATHAEAEVTFTLADNSNIAELDEIIIPEGVIISTTDGYIEYTTLEQIYISGQDVSATVQCMSVESGSDYKVPANTLTNIVSKVGYDLVCNNNAPSSGGSEEYDDDEYRYLLMNWRLINLKGSLEAYEEYFSKADGVDDYKLIPNWDGTGTMKVIVDPGTPYLLNTIYDDLQNTITQATEDIVMFAPEDKLIDIEAVVNVDIDQINPYSTVEKQDIQSRIINCIHIFVDGGYLADDTYYPGLSIGEDFIPHKLAVFLDDEIPELKNISFNYPLDYISILDDEIGKSNNINVSVI